MAQRRVDPPDGLMAGDAPDPRRRAGGCLCGAVRYSMAWPPLDLVTCSCRHCQKQSGGALTVVAMVGRDDIAVTGELATYEDVGNSGRHVWRRFCPSCGSPVLTDTPATVEAGIVLVKAGTLDDTGDLHPTTHYWTERAQGWVLFPPSDGIALRMERPMTAGGEEPPCLQ